MPVTAKLSRKFYETFGDEIADELVEWFNQVDATYRFDLRELNELNFSRFDAKLEQRLAELDATWGGRWAALDAKLEQRAAELDAKWNGRWTALEAKLEQRVAELRGEMRAGLATLETRLVRWMFGFWTLSMVTLLGALIGVIRFVPR